MLHLNELPLRHLLVQLDGLTHGPKAFSGAIDKLLKTCHTLSLTVTKFCKIDGNLFPDVDRNILRSTLFVGYVKSGILRIMPSRFSYSTRTGGAFHVVEKCKPNPPSLWGN